MIYLYIVYTLEILRSLLKNIKNRINTVIIKLQSKLNIMTYIHCIPKFY